MPTNSQTLSEFFHQNGVNMRYLGQVHKEIQGKNMKVIENLIHRDIIVRCMKHFMSKQLRESGSSARLVAHTLNCLLAPEGFKQRFNEWYQTAATEQVTAEIQKEEEK